jgi:hypothetical protein
VECCGETTLSHLGADLPNLWANDRRRLFTVNSRGRKVPYLSISLSLSPDCGSILKPYLVRVAEDGDWQCLAVSVRMSLAICLKICSGGFGVFTHKVVYGTKEVGGGSRKGESV